MSQIQSHMDKIVDNTAANDISGDFRLAAAHSLPSPTPSPPILSMHVFIPRLHNQIHYKKIIIPAINQIRIGFNSYRRRYGGDDTAATTTSSVSASLFSEPTGDEAASAKVGARVRVKVPLKVYHIPKVQEVDLKGFEGVLKQYVPVWNGKHISANLPYKIEFLEKVEGRDAPVKFFAHLKDDEFEYID